jgi:hypothetical protein
MSDEKENIITLELEMYSSSICENSKKTIKFIDYKIPPYFFSLIMEKKGYYIHSREFENIKELREISGLPENPSSNYDYEELLEKLNKVKMYNIGDVNFIIKPNGFTDSVCYHVIQNKYELSNNDSKSTESYVYITQQAEEFAKYKGILVFECCSKLSKLKKLDNALRKVFGDRYHWCKKHNCSMEISLIKNPNINK